MDPVEAGRVQAPPGRVIVVGAGPAGLAAASHLKVGPALQARQLWQPFSTLGCLSGMLTGSGSRALVGGLGSWMVTGPAAFQRPAPSMGGLGDSAGPAALQAATQFACDARGPGVQRCGVECTVLEASDRVGGRVSTAAAPGFAAPLDLGASIITGAPSRSARLGSQPSAVRSFTAQDRGGCLQAESADGARLCQPPAQQPAGALRPGTTGTGALPAQAVRWAARPLLSMWPWLGASSRPLQPPRSCRRHAARRAHSGLRACRDGRGCGEGPAPRPVCHHCQVGGPAGPRPAEGLSLGCRHRCGRDGCWWCGAAHWQPHGSTRRQRDRLWGVTCPPPACMPALEASGPDGARPGLPHAPG